MIRITTIRFEEITTSNSLAHVHPRNSFVRFRCASLSVAVEREREFERVKTLFFPLSPPWFPKIRVELVSASVRAITLTWLPVLVVAV